MSRLGKVLFAYFSLGLSTTPSIGRSHLLLIAKLLLVVSALRFLIPEGVRAIRSIAMLVMLLLVSMA